MRFNSFGPAFAVAATVVMAAGAVSAHARLVSSTPAANTTVPAPGSIALVFSERMVPAFSTFEVVSSVGQKPSIRTAVSRDGHSITGRPASPLLAGAYTVTWRAASSDGHRMTGSYAFNVR